MTSEKAPISLRPAAPTVEDGLVFSRLLDQAQEGYFRAMLGRRAGDIIARAFTRPSHDLSYQYVTNVIGFLVAGYILYEIVQPYLPKGVFDWKDIYWTIIGGFVSVMFLLLLRLIVKNNRVFIKF
jgi:hypothetical protein